jgi:hypothetical protein
MMGHMCKVNCACVRSMHMFTYEAGAWALYKGDLALEKYLSANLYAIENAIIAGI